MIPSELARPSQAQQYRSQTTCGERVAANEAWSLRSKLLVLGLAVNLLTLLTWRNGAETQELCKPQDGFKTKTIRTKRTSSCFASSKGTTTARVLHTSKLFILLPAWLTQAGSAGEHLASSSRGALTQHLLSYCKLPLLLYYSTLALSALLLFVLCSSQLIEALQQRSTTEDAGHYLYGSRHRRSFEETLASARQALTVAANRQRHSVASDQLPEESTEMATVRAPADQQNVNYSSYYFYQFHHNFHYRPSNSSQKQQQQRRSGDLTESATSISGEPSGHSRAQASRMGERQQVTVRVRTSEANVITAHKLLPKLSVRPVPAVTLVVPKQSANAPLAMGESQWIPIVTNNKLSGAATNLKALDRNRAHGVSRTAAASALTDFPVASDQSSQQGAHKPARPSSRPPTHNWQSAREPQQALESHLRNVHGHRTRFAHHHRHNSFGPDHHAQPRHRRPRLNEAVENELLDMGPPLPAVSKMYKRVLLCDKTLVSLEYVRDLDPEPRPGYGAANHLDEHEITDIVDNLIHDHQLDGSYESLAARHDEPPTNRTAENSISSPAIPLEPSNAGADRRAYSPALLNDEDPLVRCDMWDLEKGLKSRKPPESVLRMAVRADFDTVRDAINRCRQLSERTLPPDDELRGDGQLELLSNEDLISLFSMKRGLMPGTKWCGLGDQANSYNDLGPKHRIDICCRAHDHCPIRSKPFRNDYGILNIGLYTKSHCDCDADFYRCLREVRSRTADMLGNLYFNVMKLQCMREERLKVCREMKPIALGFERCVRYEDSPVKRVFKFTTPPVAY